MSIREDSLGYYIGECDIGCGITAETYKTDWNDARHKLRKLGWISRKIDGAWHNICPDCKPEFTGQPRLANIPLRRN